MTYAKTELFDKDLQIAASLFKSLSHPARLAILNYLATTKVCMTGDISKEIPLGRTTVNQHLKELKDIGLITGEIEGVKVNYCLNISNIKQLSKIFNSYISDLNCCN